MPPALSEAHTPPPGTWPLFTFRGIRVFLHWTWLLVAYYHISKGAGSYPNIGWDIAEYLMLFAIVLTHEFGHAFASRQVGGKAERILLWPFGGIAFVQVPPRAGAYLWGIAAGPLVNVVLWPILFFIVGRFGEISYSHFSLLPDFYPDGGINEDGTFAPVPTFLFNIFVINTVLIVFNLIPAYPLDGGQIFRGLLWLFLGPIKSLLIAAWTGLVLGAAGIVFVLIKFQSNGIWLAVMMGLIVQQSWSAIASLRAWKSQQNQIPPIR